MDGAAVSMQALGGLVISDVTRQRQVRVDGVPATTTVSEFVKTVLKKMGLMTRDAAGQPVTYRARVERNGRQLTGGERVGDALQPEDRVTLTPYIAAG